MKFQSLLFSASLVVAESGFWGSVLGSRTTRLGLEASAGFLQRTQKAQSRLEKEEVKRATIVKARTGPDLAAKNSAADAVVLVQQEAKLITDKSVQAVAPARAPADLLADARRKLEEPPVEPSRLLSSGALGTNTSAGNETGVLEPRVSVSKKWSEIKTAQEEAKRAVTEGADLLKDDSVKHLMSWEAMLISNVATGEDEHAQPCIAHCRYGEQVRHSWQECVERCVEDGMTRRMLLVGLPESERAAAKLDAPLPAGIDELKRKRTARRRARSEDL